MTGVPLTPLPGRVGQVLPGEGAVVTHRPDLPRASVTVENTSAWPVVITSHFHFFEANRLLRFDRGAAFGMHLDVMAGGSERFEPGESREVALVGYAGDRAVFGFNGLTDCVLGVGAEFERQRDRALDRAHAAGFLDTATKGRTSGPTTSGPTTSGE